MTNAHATKSGASGWPTTRLANARFAARHRSLNSPLFALHRRLRSFEAEAYIDSRTEIVLDGFPRSANSYARFAFHVATGKPEILAGHAHSSQLLIWGAKEGIPAVVVARHPDQACASLYQMEQTVSLVRIFGAYATFHNRISGLISRGEILLASFDEVVTDFGSVMQRVNTRFGTRFPKYSRSATNEARVSALLEESNRIFEGGKLSEASVSRPSSERLSSAQILSNLGRSEERARQRALESYELVTQNSQSA